MDPQEIPLPHNYRTVIDRFAVACQADERVVAAFLGGSHASGTADAYSDLDLYLITTDEAYENFLAGRDAFVHLLGEPLFLEDFGSPHGAFYIFPDATEGELWIGRASHFHHLLAGPYSVLVDKQGVLAGAVFPRHEADPAEQRELLRRQITGFWHELSHFIKAMGRRQLWFAYGQIEAMRRICVTLARLRYDFADAWVGEEPHFKVEQVFPVEQLSSLQSTYCPLEYEEMLRAGISIFRFYQDAAPNLAKAHGVTYQPELERILGSQLLKL